MECGHAHIHQMHTLSPLSGGWSQPAGSVMMLPDEASPPPCKSSKAVMTGVS